MDTTIASLIGEEPFDLTIRGGRIVTDGRVVEGDLGVRDGRIAAIGGSLPPGRRDVDATGRWVLPGGIDSHCHVEQRSGMGMMCADDFYSATVSAAFGGTTTILPFAAQHREMSVPEVLADYSQRAAEKAVIDYGFHLILANPDDATLSTDLPAAIRDGITSLKVYMTYDRMKLKDYQLLEVLALARAEGALVMVHAENNDMIRWIAQRLIDRGHTAPKFHGVAHDPLAETEAAYRAIALARLVDVPLLLVHVAGGDTVEVIRQAQTLGANVLAESCPQYLFLTAADMDRPGLEGAMFCCSPPARDADAQEAIWRGLIDGTLATYSSDHAPYRFDETGKLPKGDATTFKEMANGVPGIELRLPLLFSEGFLKGRIDIHQFVALTATNHARLYGLAPRKGAIALGADADIAVWNAERETTISAAMLHDNAGYTPYEGRTIQGWPEVVVSRGRVVIEDGALHAERGSGQYLRRGAPDLRRRAPVAPVQRPHGRVLKALIGLGEDKA
ncbi:dihydropyrimidinase [Variovorax sp. DAIF25]|uniref:dihydropyrimidinase n=1 Tax=Variovorax sp. DAIF25 TaxID=3080983 RepID=UPI003D6B611C